MLNHALLFMTHYGNIALLILAICAEYLIFRRGLNMRECAVCCWQIA